MVSISTCYIYKFFAVPTLYPWILPYPCPIAIISSSSPSPREFFSFHPHPCNPHYHHTIFLKCDHTCHCLQPCIMFNAHTHVDRSSMPLCPSTERPEWSGYRSITVTVVVGIPTVSFPNTHFHFLTILVIILQFFSSYCSFFALLCRSLDASQKWWW